MKEELREERIKRQALQVSSACSAVLHLLFAIAAANMTQIVLFKVKCSCALVSYKCLIFGHSGGSAQFEVDALNMIQSVTKMAV